MQFPSVAGTCERGRKREEEGEEGEEACNQVPFGVSEHQLLRQAVA